MEFIPGWDEKTGKLNAESVSLVAATVSGTVRRYNPEKGWGFIAVEGEEKNLTMEEIGCRSPTIPQYHKNNDMLGTRGHGKTLYKYQSLN